MKRENTRGRTRRRLAALLTMVLALGPLALPAQGLAYEDEIRGIKTLSALDREERTFQLDYRVWSGKSVSRAVDPCDVVLLLDVSSSMAGTAGHGGKEDGLLLDRMRTGAKGFLRELEETSPASRAGLVLFGKTAETAGPESLESGGTDRLLEALSSLRVQPSGEPDYAAALEQAADLVEQWGNRGKRPLYLVTVSSGLWAEETGGTGGPLEKLQALRDLGARAYTVLLCGSPEKETEEFWQAMSSAPLSTHHYVSQGEAENCLSQVRREIASAFTVEVRQRLDPRFEIAQQEQDRLRREGAHVRAEQDGSFTVSWEVDLPRSADAPWGASLTVRAKEAFPGGNDVPTDSEETGLYRAGKLVAQLPATTANVALRLDLSDVEARIFLGEKVHAAVDGTGVEEAMGAPLSPSWFGRGQTGSFSYLWEDGDGRPIGSLEQLAELKPERDTAYRLRVSYRPDTPGLISAGEPVKEQTASALYKVRVVGGTLRVKASGDGVKLDRSSSLAFRVEKKGGKVFFLTARMETDPENGRAFLEAELEGLPYGAYTVTPLSGGRLGCRESVRVCSLGVWDRDDTVSTDRARAAAEFTLREP